MLCVGERIGDKVGVQLFGKRLDGFDRRPHPLGQRCLELPDARQFKIFVGGVHPVFDAQVGPRKN